jgi:hypothetical protein
VLLVYAVEKYEGGKERGAAEKGVISNEWHHQVK